MKNARTLLYMALGILIGIASSSAYWTYHERSVARQHLAKRAQYCRNFGGAIRLILIPPPLNSAPITRDATLAQPLMVGNYFCLSRSKDRQRSAILLDRAVSSFIDGKLSEAKNSFRKLGQLIEDANP